MPTANTAPRYVAARKTWHGKITAADEDRTGGGTLVNIVAAAAQGSLVEQVKIIAEASTTFGQVRLFLYDGSANNLFYEVTVPISNPDDTQKAWLHTVSFGTLVIPTTWILKASGTAGETFHVFAHGGDY